MLNRLIIFLKNPVLGDVKTRIAKTEGNVAALKIYKDLLQKCRREALNVKAERHLYYANFVPQKDDWLKRDFKKHLQTQVDSLGEKMKAAFAQQLEKEASKVIIIGSDCYDLTASVIEEAFESLETHDVVIGPANDGGYYLLGIKKYHPFLFDGVAWSTEWVLQQTLDRAKQHNLSVKLLEELIDLDTIEDVQKSSFPYPFKTKQA